MNRPPSSAEDVSALTTQNLLERARKGSNLAWEVFYRRYRRFLVFAVQMRIPGFAKRQFDAEDVLQSAFLSAWQEIQTFEYRGEGSFRLWLRQIVVNRFKNKLRDHERRRKKLPIDSQALREGEVPDEGEAGEDPAAAATRIEEQARFIEQLRQLSDEDQEILGMRIFEKLGWSDIGGILGCDRTTARRRCGEAVKRLERLLT